MNYRNKIILIISGIISCVIVGIIGLYVSMTIPGVDGESDYYGYFQIRNNYIDKQHENFERLRNNLLKGHPEIAKSKIVEALQSNQDFQNLQSSSDQLAVNCADGLSVITQPALGERYVNIEILSLQSTALLNDFAIYDLAFDVEYSLFYDTDGAGKEFSDRIKVVSTFYFNNDGECKMMNSTANVFERSDEEITSPLMSILIEEPEIKKRLLLKWHQVQVLSSGGRITVRFTTLSDKFFDAIFDLKTTKIEITDYEPVSVKDDVFLDEY
ncbi:MAG: hypothetical protein Q8P90_04620 [bacterium]|nr:hypothetical protein [bacterium]